MPDEIEITGFDALNRSTKRTYETTGAISDGQRIGAKLQAVSGLGIPQSQRFLTKGAYATPTTPEATSNTATRMVFLLNVTLPNGDIIPEYKYVFPCVKSTLLAGQNIPIVAAITTYFNNFKTAGKCRVSNGGTVNSIVRGYTSK